MDMTGACIVGRLAFSNFAFHPTSFGDGTALTSDQIMVDPLDVTAGDPGLQFTASWGARGQGGEDTGITYEVTVLPGEPLIDSAILGMAFTVNHNTVLAAVQETICLTGTGLDSCPPADTVILRLDNLAGSPPATTSASFAPQSQISVLKDIFIDGQSINANGVITSVDNHYPAPATSTPEPVTPLLGLSGLLLMWQLARRRQPH
jgi:uncharacterized protein (TIGR03382 family)